MKRFPTFLALCIVLVIIGGAFAVGRKREPDVLDEFKPYVAKETTLYFDPSQLFKSMPASASAKVAPKDMQPVMIRYMKVANIPFNQINKTLHKDLLTKDGWMFSPMPVSSSLTGFNFIEAHKGGSIASMGSAFSGSEPDRSVMVMPDMSGMMTPTIKAGKPVFPTPKAYTIMETRKMATWEVLWLRMRHLGHNPFSNERDLVTAMGP